MTTKSKKFQFEHQFNSFITNLADYISNADKQWTIKGFIDMYKNIYTI